MVSAMLSKAAVAAILGAAAVSAADCTFTWEASSGDTCSSMANLWGITVAQFQLYNPGVSCSGSLTAGTSYCVEWNYGAGDPVGSSTTKGSTTTTTTTKTTTTTTTTKTTTTTTGNGGSTPSPVQDGINPNCKGYYLAQSGDYCQKIADSYGISLSDFLSWNPAVGSTCSSLFLGYYYCVSLTSATPTTSKAPTNTGPTPTQTGIISTCNNYYLVASGDTCQNIVNKYGTFTLSQFYSWNPAVGSTCASLWVGYYVCVGVPGISTVKPSSTSSGPTPTQTGIVSGCKKWYQAVSGDYCQKIADANGISLSQFYSWNPAVGSTCASLFLGYYYCVGV